MSSGVIRVLSWLIGIAAVVGMVLFVDRSALSDLLRSIGFSGVAVWVSLTVAARLVQGEATVVPMAAIGFAIKRADVFWIGWIRTFSNQIVPVSGIVAYAHAIRSRTSISWSQLAALAAPQFVLASTAIGVVGTVASFANFATLNSKGTALVIVYLAITILSIAIVHGSILIAKVLPAFLADRVRLTSLAVQKIAASPAKIIRLVSYHIAVILLRGVRVWLLFVAAQVTLNWSEALLLIAVAESTFLIQLTPGGLGIREGAIVGAAALIGVSVDIAIGVAILDRLLTVSLIALLTPPSLLILRGSPDSSKERKQTGGQR